MSTHSSFTEQNHCGPSILRDPRRNKDMAFTLDEREVLGLHGFLPPGVQTIEEQVAAELEHISSKEEPLEKYIGLIALLNRNETLFFRVMIENLELLTPLIYTPVVGQACQQFSHIFRRPRGLYLSPDDKGRIAQRLRNWPGQDIRLIVVTDNERILGLGDQGAGGMGISIGKLALYTAAAGIHPSLCLPISLDVGTDNEGLLKDPLYLGYRKRRLRGAAYEAFVDEFVQAVKAECPRAILQWEDFKKCNAFRLLARYQEKLPSFNDDIQGTAAVALAGVLAGLRIIRQPLSEQRILLVGAGAAGVGIARLVRRALLAQGLSESEARKRQLLCDSSGLVHDKIAGLDPHKAEFALNARELSELGLPQPLPTSLEAITEAFRPTVLIGTTAHPGMFTEKVIRSMAAHCRRPMIFPLSNPTSQTECTAKDAITFSDGRALVATGSPFEPVSYRGKEFVIGQSNNVFIFPGVGLGALISEAKSVTESMFLAAAEALADFTLRQGAPSEVLYPRIKDLRAISRCIGFRAAQVVREEKNGLALDDAAIEAALQKFIWTPEYPKFNSQARHSF